MTLICPTPRPPPPTCCVAAPLNSCWLLFPSSCPNIASQADAPQCNVWLRNGFASWASLAGGKGSGEQSAATCDQLGALLNTYCGASDVEAAFIEAIPASPPAPPFFPSPSAPPWTPVLSATPGCYVFFPTGCAMGGYAPSTSWMLDSASAKGSGGGKGGGKGGGADPSAACEERRTLLAAW